MPDEIQILLNCLPQKIHDAIQNHPQKIDLCEVVMDLGAHPEIRYKETTERLIGLGAVTEQDIHSVTEKVGLFTADNRAGLARTLHRISAIRNRHGKIIGLTCRIGRAIEGVLNTIRDQIESEKNVLLLGPPGIGKTTLLREAARLLSVEFDRRVIVVDTSNEIAGDSDIPHPAIGLARRMQVSSPDQQHAVMIEAVENHMPQVIIVDEIGTEAEAQAARTIAERGIQLIATAHGKTLQNLIKNPTLSDLVGGVQSVVLGDEEAKFRGTQKTVLERKSLPTFEVLIEVPRQGEFIIYHSVAQAVDAFLRGEQSDPQFRRRGKGEDIIIQETKPQPKGPQIFPYGINATFLSAAIKYLNIEANVVHSISDADMVVTTKGHLKSQSKLSAQLEGRQLAVHVLNASGKPQIEKFLRQYFHIPEALDAEEQDAIAEIEELSKRVQSEKIVVDATPKNAYLRRIQHQALEAWGLRAQSIGEEPNRRVRIYPTRITKGS